MNTAALWAMAGIVVSYLIGSIPTAVLVGRRHGIDPRAVGDRNPGYWNTKETLGRRASLPVFLGDAAKGLVAGGIGTAVVHAAGAPWWVGYACVGAAMAGHAWPVFAGFRGGRAILTFVGGVIVLSPYAAACAIFACVVVSVATSFAWGARVGVFGFPFLQLLFDPPIEVAATGLLMSLIGLRFLQAARAERARAAEPAQPPSGTPGPSDPPAGAPGDSPASGDGDPPVG